MMVVGELLKHLRIYLIGIEFNVITDCNAIRTALNKWVLVPRTGRWWLVDIMRWDEIVPKTRWGFYSTRNSTIRRSPRSVANLLLNILVVNP